MASDTAPLSLADKLVPTDESEHRAIRSFARAIDLCNTYLSLRAAASSTSSSPTIEGFTVRRDSEELAAVKLGVVKLQERLARRSPSAALDTAAIAPSDPAAACVSVESVAAKTSVGTPASIPSSEPATASTSNPQRKRAAAESRDTAKDDSSATGGSTRPPKKQRKVAPTSKSQPTQPFKSDPVLYTHPHTFEVIDVRDPKHRKTKALRTIIAHYNLCAFCKASTHTVDNCKHLEKKKEVLEKRQKGTT